MCYVMKVIRLSEALGACTLCDPSKMFSICFHYQEVLSYFSPYSSMLNPNSSLLNPNSALLNLNSSLLNPYSSLLNPNSSLLNPNSSLLNPNSSLLNPNSSLLNPYSSLHNPYLLLLFSFHFGLYCKPQSLSPTLRARDKLLCYLINFFSVRLYFLLTASQKTKI